MTGARSADHAPAKSQPTATAKTAANAQNAPRFTRETSFYFTAPRAMSENTIAKMATVSTMPSAAR